MFTVEFTKSETRCRILVTIAEEARRDPRDRQRHRKKLQDCGIERPGGEIGNWELLAERRQINDKYWYYDFINKIQNVDSLDGY